MVSLLCLVLSLSLKLQSVHHLTVYVAFKHAWLVRFEILACCSSYGKWVECEVKG